MIGEVLRRVVITHCVNIKMKIDRVLYKLSEIIEFQVQIEQIYWVSSSCLVSHKTIRFKLKDAEQSLDKFVKSYLRIILGMKFHQTSSIDIIITLYYVDRYEVGSDESAGQKTIKI